MWGVVSLDNENNLANKYLRLGNNKYAFTEEHGDVRLIGFIPFYPPVSTGETTNYFIRLHKEPLEALEAELAKPTKTKHTFVCTHSATELFYPAQKSSKTGRDIIQILNDPAYNVRALINGHTHPKTPEFVIFENFTECTLVQLVDNRTVGLATIDNGRFSYSSINLDDPVKVAVTYPVPNRVATYTESGNGIQIRLISFGPGEYKFNVEGYGVMRKERQLKSNAWLYVLDVDVPNGRHVLNITGDAKVSFEYVVGQNGGKAKYIREKPYNGELFFWLLFFLSVFDASMVFPLNLPFFRNYESSIKKNFIRSICFGNFLVANKIANSHTLVKFIIRVILILSLFSPFEYYEVEGQKAFMTCIGYCIGGKFRIDVQCTHFVLYFLMYIYIPYVCVIAFAGSSKLVLYIILTILSFGAQIIGFAFWSTFGYNIMPERYNFSPLFRIYPLILLATTIFNAFTIYRRRSRNNCTH